MYLEDVIRLITLSLVVLLGIGQLRIYFAIRKTALEANKAFEDLSVATAELVMSARRDIERMRVEVEEGIKAQLDGSVVNIDVARNRKPA